VKTMLKKIVALFSASALTLSLIPTLWTARGDSGISPMSHCVSLGLTCATCTTGAMIISCHNPFPPGYFLGSCQQGGSGCPWYSDWDCGFQYYCSDGTPTGTNCSYNAAFICDPP